MKCLLGSKDVECGAKALWNADCQKRFIRGTLIGKSKSHERPYAGRIYHFK